MKTLYFFSFCFIAIQSCGCLKQNKVESATVIATQASVEKNNIVIEYTAATRGFYKKIRLDNGRLSTSYKRGKTGSYKSISKKKWQHILQLLEPINLEAIAELVPPSKDFQFDGAALARINITKNTEAFSSAAFDHENPPLEIKELVEELLSISEKIE